MNGELSAAFKHTCLSVCVATGGLSGPFPLSPKRGNQKLQVAFVKHAGVSECVCGQVCSKGLWDCVSGQPCAGGRSQRKGPQRCQTFLFPKAASTSTGTDSPDGKDRLWRKTAPPPPPSYLLGDLGLDLPPS